MTDFAGQMSMDAYTLGTQLAEYKPRAVAPVVRVVLGFVLGVISVFMLISGVASSQVSSDDRPAILIIGAVLALISWAMIEFWIKARGLVVRLYTDGLIRYQYGKSFVARWDEVDSVWQRVTKHYTNGVYTGTTHVYTVQKTDGTKVKFDDALKNVEPLGNAIQDEVTKRLLPRTLKLYQDGGTCSFGKLSVGPIGLSWGDKSLPWSEIEAVQINKGLLTVKKQGKWLKWATIPVSTVPNLRVALTLVDRIVGLNLKK